jgi:hypothetical protein
MVSDASLNKDYELDSYILWPKVALALLFGYIIASPYYVFKSGYPQPADFLLALGAGIGFSLFLANRSTKINSIYFVGLLFGIYTFGINIIHYVFYPDLRLVLSSMFYVYNVSIFIFISAVLRTYPQKTFKLVYFGIAISLIMQLVHMELLPSNHPFRETGSFNNPNQLAYWALLSSSMIIIIKYKSRLNLLDFLLLGMAFYIQLESLSKAGIITSVLLFLILLCSSSIRLRHKVAVFGLLTLLIVSAVANFSNVSSLVLRNETVQGGILRIASIGEEADDSAEGRGYLRVLSNPIFLMLGSGEGAYWRYDKDGGNHELHSGLATLLFAYGPVGFLLFCYLLYKIFKGRGLLFAAVLFNILLFGAVHQNIRFASFWLFLGVVNSLPRNERAYNNETLEKIKASV